MDLHIKRHNLLNFLSLVVLSGTILFVASCLPEEPENLLGDMQPTTPKATAPGARNP